MSPAGCSIEPKKSRFYLLRASARTLTVQQANFNKVLCLGANGSAGIMTGSAAATLLDDGSGALFVPFAVDGAGGFFFVCTTPGCTVRARRGLHPAMFNITVTFFDGM